MRITTAALAACCVLAFAAHVQGQVTGSSPPSYPEAPAGFTVTVGADFVDMRWNPLAGFAGNYVVALTPQGGTTMYGWAATATSYHWSGLAAGAYEADVHADPSGAWAGRIPVTVTNASPPARRIFGTNNFSGWGAYAGARSLLSVNGDRLAQDETDVPSALPQLAANGEYLTLCLNSYEPLTSLNAHRWKYVSMVADHARTYGPGGSFWNSHPSIAQYAVQTFELMNEPYGWWYRNGDNDPAVYAHIVAAAIRKGHAANPNAKFYIVLAPGDVLLANGRWINWNAALLAAVPNLFQLADGFSIHLYHSPSQFQSTLDTVKNWAWGQRGGNGKPFIITESNLPDVAPEQDFVNAMPQFVQAVDARRAWVHELFIFCWHGYTGNDFFGFISKAGVVRQTRADSYRNAVQAALSH